MTTPVPQIHVTDGKNDRILDVITAKWIVEDEHRQSLEDTLETFNFTTFGDQPFSKWLEKRNRLIIPDEDGQFNEFVIYESVKIHDSTGLFIDVYSTASYLDLKKVKIIDPQTFRDQTIRSAANNAVVGTEWEIGIAEGRGLHTFHIESHTNPLAFLKQIANEFELELRFRVEVDGNRVVRRYVDLLQRIGRWNGREIEFGKDLEGIRRTEKNEEIVTALLGIGPEDEKGNRLEVRVEDHDALQRWGRNGQHLVDIYEPPFSNESLTLERLRALTKKELGKRVNASVEYETSILDLEHIPGMDGKAIRFGDTLRIKDTTFNPPLYIEARVFEQSRSIVDKSQKKVKLGDFKEFSEEEVTNIWRKMQLEIQNKVSLAQLWDYTYSKPEVDNKDQSIYQDGTQYADQRSDQVKQEAEQDATDKANRAEDNAKQYTDHAVIDVGRRLTDFVQEYAQKKVTQGIATPSNPEAGDLWIDVNETPHMWKRWDGNQWVPLERTNLEQMLGELQSEQIANGAVVSEKLADLAVTLEKIAENSIDTSKILDDAIDAAKLAAGAVETEALAPLAVTNDKIDSINADKITAGRINAERIQIGSGTQFAQGYDPTQKVQQTDIQWLTGSESRDWVILLCSVGNGASNYVNGRLYGRRVSGHVNSAVIDVVVNHTNAGIPSGSFRSIGVQSASDYELVRCTYQGTEYIGLRYMGNAMYQIWSNMARFDGAFESGGSHAMHAYDISAVSNVQTLQNQFASTEKSSGPIEWPGGSSDDANHASERVSLWQYQDTVFIDGGSIYANSVTANQIAAGTITANEIASNAITTGKIEANAVTAQKIESGAVDTDKLAANAVVADKIAANAVTTAKIEAGAITAAKIAAGTITTDLIHATGLDAGVIKFGTMSGQRIQAGSITGDQILAGAITTEKIATAGLSAGVIKSGTLDASRIAAGSITTEKIAAEGISADVIKTGTMHFDRLRGGTAVLGGQDNGYGNLRVLDTNNEVVAEISTDGESEGGFAGLTVGSLKVTEEINAPEIVKRRTDNITFYVRGSENGSDDNSGLGGWDNALYSIQEAIDRIPEIYDGTCEILISNQYEAVENIVFRGISGGGQIILNFRGNTFRGYVKVASCGLRIEIREGTIQRDTGTYLIDNETSPYVYITEMTLNGNGQQYGVRTWRGGQTYMMSCEIYNVDSCMYGSSLSRWYITSCAGLGNTYGVRITNGSLVHCGTTCPAGGTANYSSANSSTYIGSFTINSGSAKPPAPPVVEVTRTWTASSSRSWRDNWGWRSDNTHVYQGEWSGNGRHKGCWFFGSSMRNTLNGKKIKRVRIRASRRSSGGSSGSVNAIFRMHSHASQPSGEPNTSSTTHSVRFSWGESKWFTLPSSFHSLFSNGNWYGVALFTTSRNNSDYMIFNGSLTVEVTYED